MADIFISYARQDRERAIPFVEMLESQGWSVWWDRAIGPGSAFSKVIETEIAQAKCVIVLWTRDSVQSAWVNAEAGEGLERQVLIPVKLEDVDVPLIFRQTQAANLNNWPRSDNQTEILQLLEAISRAIDKPLALPVSNKKRRNYLLPAIAATTLLVMVGVFYLLSNARLDTAPNTIPANQTGDQEPPAAQTYHSIAVLPFANMDENLSFELAEGLERLDEISVSHLYDPGAAVTADYTIQGIRTGDSLMVSLYDNTANHTRFELEVDLARTPYGETTRKILRRIAREFDQTLNLGESTIDNGTYLEYLSIRSELRELTSEADWRASVGKLEELILDYPRWAEALASLCSANISLYSKTGETSDFEQAERHCYRAARLGKDNPRVILSLGTLYATAGQLDPAMENYRQVLLLSPNNTSAMRGLAKVLSKQDKLPDAVRILKQAQEIEPQNWANYEALAAIYFLEGMYELAAKEYEAVKALVPNNPLALSDLGASYFMLEDFPRAITAWELSLAIEPNYGALSNLGYAYFMEGKFLQALASYKQAIAINEGDYRMWLNAGEAAFHCDVDEMPYYTKSMELAQRQLSINPDAADVLSALALTTATVGDKASSKDYVYRAQIADGNDVYVLYDVAVAYSRMGLMEERDKTIEKMLLNGYSKTLIGMDANFK